MSERKGTKALELWCRRLLAGYDGVSIDNMSTSWRNGLAFCALIHRFRPDLIDFSSLKPEDIYLNNELAFRTAETHLGIPALLDPEDMVDSDVPDRLSILTYLSQFYQRLGHTVTKSPINDNNSEVSSPQSPISPQSPSSIAASLKLNKGGYERCTVCGIPVYLAQRLIVSHKLYHRSCFRCGSCGTQLSPHSCYENATSTEFCCESCKNAEEVPALHEEDNRMGMLMFHDDPPQAKAPVVPAVSKNSSISERIKLFENNEDIKINNKKQPDRIRSWRNSDTVDGKSISSEDHEISLVEDKSDDPSKTINSNTDIVSKENKSTDITFGLVCEESTDSPYKSNTNKFSFLLTQLATNECLESSHSEKYEPKTDDMRSNMPELERLKTNVDDNTIQDKTNTPMCLESDSCKINSNIPDDVRLEEKLTQSCKISESVEEKDKVTADIEYLTHDLDIPVILPPRRRIMVGKKSKEQNVKNATIATAIIQTHNEYPDDLNPFSEDEENAVETNKSVRLSTNPFGSSDDEEEEESTHTKHTTPVKMSPLSFNNTWDTTIVQRTYLLNNNYSAVPALNPFWSDGEEPSTDEEDPRPSLDTPQYMYDKNGVSTSTLNLPLTKARRAKPPAPKPPVITVHEVDNSCSLDDGASLSSMSSHCSTVNSEAKHSLKLTPKSRKKRPAPTPPDNTSIISTGSGSEGGKHLGLIQGKHLFADEPYSGQNSESLWRRVKGPAPGLPLPGKRVVRPELSPMELQSQLDLLETQQLGLERQGVLIEQMIRDKCEGENPTPAPPEEVEDLVIQLCELVNEKNDLFRKQAELMYIRRQQRLEQEQADIEHEIRVIQARPAVNRIDADKAREEQLVARLVSIVRLRDELVQQLDSERRRERAEDAAIATCIAQRRANRNNSDSNNSSMQSEDIVRTPKKSKVKDRVKKQLKKAKKTLNPKKKESEGNSKESSAEKKEKEKTKWF